MKLRVKKAAIMDIKKVRRNNRQLLVSAEEFTFVEIIRASRIIEAKSRGIRYTGKKPTYRERKIVCRGDSMLALGKLDDKIIVKNRQENKPTNKARSIYKKMMSEI